MRLHFNNCGGFKSLWAKRQMASFFHNVCNLLTVYLLMHHDEKMRCHKKQEALQLLQLSKTKLLPLACSFWGVIVYRDVIEKDIVDYFCMPNQGEGNTHHESGGVLCRD